MKFAFAAFICVLYVTVSGSGLQAQDSRIEDIAAAQNKLASPSDEKPAATIINQSSMSDVVLLIPAELRPLIEKGEISFNAFRSARFNGAMVDEAWSKESERAGQNEQILDEIAKNGMIRGFPYGTYEDIRRRVTLTVSEKVRQVLWNQWAMVSSRASITTDVRFQEFLTNGSGIGFRAQIRRILPQRFRQNDQTKQMFRERFLISGPKALQGLSWLTFRFIDSAEDVIWAYSPANKKVRQLVYSNRSDPFLGTPFVIDDFFGNSGKLDLVSGISIDEVIQLAPFYRIDSQPLKQEDSGCFSFDFKFDDRSSHQAIATDKAVEEKSALINNADFVPRKLLRIELSQRDPYAFFGRQVIYLDTDTFMPFYKFTYDRAGVLQRATVTAQTVLFSAQPDLKIWLPSITYFYNLSNQTSAILEYQRARVCENADSSVSLSDYDPKGLIPVYASSVTPTSPTTPQPQ